MRLSVKRCESSSRALVRPKVLNDDNSTADQFHPTLSVESNGAGGDKVTVSFYNRHDDPSDCLASPRLTSSCISSTRTRVICAIRIGSAFGNAFYTGEFVATLC